MIPGLYARMGLDYQARRRDKMLRANVDALNATRRPVVDFTPEQLDRLQQLAEQLEADE